MDAQKVQARKRTFCASCHAKMAGPVPGPPIHGLSEAGEIMPDGDGALVLAGNALAQSRDQCG